MWLTVISSATVSLHYLARCLCSTATCRAPIQWSQINPDSTMKETGICFVHKNRSSPAWGKWCPSPHLKCVPPFHVWPPGCCIHPILYLKMIPPLRCLSPPAAKSWRRVRIKTQKMSVTNKNMWVCLFDLKRIIEHWFDYSSSCKFSFATQTLNVWKTFFVAQDVFHNAANILRWWYLSLIVGVHLFLN